MTALAGRVTFVSSLMNTRWAAYSQALLELGFPGCPRIVHDGVSSWTPLFFLPCIECARTEYVVLVDEDCFLLDPAQLEQLIAQLDAQPDVAVAGTPDGGTFHRHYNPVACNTFFLVIRRSSALSVARTPTLAFDEVRAMASVDHVARLDSRRLGWELSEPYYPFFWALIAAGHRIRYLDAEVEATTRATAVSLPGADGPMLLHMWWLREWFDEARNTHFGMSNRARYDALKRDWLAPRFTAPSARFVLATQRVRNLFRRLASAGRTRA